MLRGWTIDVDVERDWLYLRVTRVAPENGDETELADTLLEIAAQRRNFRLILEFTDVHVLTSLVAGQLVVLHKRVHLKGGILRLCALSDFNHDVLRLMGVVDRFHIYPDRYAAASA